MFLGKDVLKISSKFTGERQCGSAILTKRNFTEIALWHGCSPVNELHIFRTPFPRNTYGGLLLYFLSCYSKLYFQLKSTLWCEFQNADALPNLS